MANSGKEHGGDLFALDMTREILYKGKNASTTS